MGTARLNSDYRQCRQDKCECLAIRTKIFSYQHGRVSGMSAGTRQISLFCKSQLAIAERFASAPNGGSVRGYHELRTSLAP